MSAAGHEATFLELLKIRLSEFVKRFFDIVASALGLFFLSPVFVILALIIKRSRAEEVFYRGWRVGRRGKLFKILKFTTMLYPKEGENSTPVTARDDPRITATGRWLRDTKLNEIPNLWNILKGEMSMVGPRPEDPKLVAEWTESEREAILSIRPGITSPASIFYRDEEQLLQTNSVMEKYLSIIVPSKIRLDQIYAKNHDFLGDVDILFLTALTLLPGISDHPIPEHLLTWGPLSRLLTRHLNLFLVDVPIAFAAVGISGFLWRTIAPLNLGWGRAIVLAMVIALLFGLVNALLGMNRISWSYARASDALGLAISDAITTIILIAVDVFFPIWVRLPIGMWILTSLLAFFGFLIARYRSGLLTSLATRWLQWRGTSARLGERVLIVGAGEMAQTAAVLFQQGEPGKIINIIGMVDDDTRKIGLRINGNQVIGSTEEIAELVAHWNVGLILFAIGNISSEDRKKILSRCHQTPARIVLVPDLLEMLSGCLFAPVLNIEDVVSPNWDNSVPIPEVVKWLTELETLSSPENDQLLARLRTIRNALAARLTNDRDPKTLEGNRSPRSL